MEKIQKLENKFHLESWKYSNSVKYSDITIRIYYKGCFHNYEWLWYSKAICENFDECGVSFDIDFLKSLNSSVINLIEKIKLNVFCFFIL